jgi:hypothetical protein
METILVTGYGYLEPAAAFETRTDAREPAEKGRLDFKLGNITLLTVTRQFSQQQDRLLQSV